MAEDRTSAGGWTPGGPSLYSARLAAALGARVTLVTCELASAGPDPFDRSALDRIELIELPRLKGKSMPRYANAYDEQGARTQYLVEQGDVIPLSFLQSRDRDLLPPSIDVLIFAPAFHELTHPPTPPIPARLTGVELQGLLRDVDRELRVVHHRAPVDQVLDWAAFADFVFLSEEDTASAPTLARQLARGAVPTWLTRGYLGATFLDKDTERDFPSLPATVADPTGAGDCFATAFMVRYAECGDFDDAARFASAAGALAVQAPGLEGVPSRTEVEALLDRVAA